MATTANTATAATAATTRVARLWTVLLGVLAGILTALRLTAPARAARRPRETAGRTAPVLPLSSLAAPEPRREGSLPPTIKQRIRAEAHGASPVSRQRGAGLGDTVTPAVDTAVPAPADELLDRLPCAA
ncbi:DUF6344 domain-containing protein [Streptomyces sp. NPDC006733]|uniref:DUF6344 domain-containing protein n=1 Tax=Streptomyces sp. NPDC006733 TaxID=3155460 RepID=UPI0033F83E56